jgi:Domain of unknown function (DUF6249)
MGTAFEVMIPIIAIIFTFGIPGIIIFWAIQSKHRERMKLIERGLTPEEVKEYFKVSDKRPRNPYATLKWGILALSLGIGFFLANILEYTLEIGEDFMPALLLFFGGAGFIVYYMIVRTKQNGNSEKSVAAAPDKTE